MNYPHQEKQGPEGPESAAARWVLRRDRGLTAAEQDEFSQWLAADPRHGRALSEQRWGWDELDRLTGMQTSIHALPDPDLLAPRGRRRKSPLIWLFPLLLAAAAVVAVIWSPLPTGRTAVASLPAATSNLAAPLERQVLEDGSSVDLNRGARLEVAFTPTERRVRLLQGEANFTVAKNPARPFFVSAGGVTVQAVGTVFNVRLEAQAVEVLVSEGTVKVAPEISSPAETPPILVTVSQRTRVARGQTPVAAPVETLTPAELDSRLAWQPRLLDFTNAPLAEIVAEFNRRNAVRIVVTDPALAVLHLSATFRSDNVESFVHLMESDFGMRAERRGEQEIVLRSAK